MAVSDGEAGRSAREQYEKKVAAKQAKRIDVFGLRIGKVLNFLIADSKTAPAWNKGATGEKAVGEFLNKFAQENGFRVLHDRAIPGSKANIDHILISNRGIFVIDAKNYSGKVEIRNVGSLFNSKEVLYVGNRNQSKIVEGVKKQVSIVSDALTASQLSSPVTGVLAFFGAEFPVFFAPQVIDGVLINGKGLATAISSQDVVEGINIESVTEYLKKAFPAKL